MSLPLPRQAHQLRGALSCALFPTLHTPHNRAPSLPSLSLHVGARVRAGGDQKDEKLRPRNLNPNPKPESGIPSPKPRTQSKAVGTAVSQAGTLKADTMKADTLQAYTLNCKH